MDNVQFEIIPEKNTQLHCLLIKINQLKVDGYLLSITDLKVLRAELDKYIRENE